MHKLTVNVSKTDWLILELLKRSPSTVHTLEINGVTVEAYDFIKYLGVAIDKQFSYNEHVKSSMKKWQRELNPFVLFQIRYQLKFVSNYYMRLF